MEVMRPRLLDPLAVIAHVAAVTTRIDLGVGVVLLPLRVPVQLARTLATLDAISNGRLIAGLGLGNKNPGLYAEHGVPTSGRLDRYLAGLDVLRRLLAEGQAAYDGPEWSIVGQTGIPPATRTPHPPIWLGARSEVAVRRAANLADGLLGAGSGGHEEFAGWVDVVKDELEAIGRDPATFTIASRVYVLVDPTPESVGRMHKWFGAVYGNESLADRVALVGDIDAVKERVADLHSNGVGHIVLNPVLDYERHLEVFANGLLGVDGNTSDL
jgi:alkanesulfonate monooxygenase SsuD/methylene tetrahydromethanopterin reductase-like flavin-dependent oxidoreductase (luciferase family)